MLVGNFEFRTLKETIWAWLKVFVTPKGDQSGLLFVEIFDLSL